MVPNEETKNILAPAGERGIDIYIYDLRSTRSSLSRVRFPSYSLDLHSTDSLGPHSSVCTVWLITPSLIRHTQQTFTFASSIPLFPLVSPVPTHCSLPSLAAHQTFTFAGSPGHPEVPILWPTDD